MNGERKQIKVVNAIVDSNINSQLAGHDKYEIGGCSETSNRQIIWEVWHCRLLREVFIQHCINTDLLRWCWREQNTQSWSKLDIIKYNNGRWLIKMREQHWLEWQSEQCRMQDYKPGNTWSINLLIQNNGFWFHSDIDLRRTNGKLIWFRTE